MNSIIDSGQLFAKAVTNYENDNNLELAIEYHQAGRLKEAMQTYQRVLASDANNCVALNNLSLLFDDNTALQILKLTLDVDPDYLDALINMCSRLMNKNNPTEALIYARRAEKISLDDARVKQLLIDLGAPLIPSVYESPHTKQPEYSVIIPTHRRDKLLARALSSIKQQSSEIQHEIIVVSDCDDALTDDVCRNLLQSTDTYIRRSGSPGPSASRNLALQLARGKIVLFLDDDDAWHPDFLASLNFCEPLQKGQPVYFNCTVVKESRKLSGPEFRNEKFFDTHNRLNENVFIKNQVHMSCFAFPRELLFDLIFDPHMKAYEDWDFLLSIFEKKMPIHIPVLGSIIHEVDDESSDRRGNSVAAKDLNAVIDYLYVYRRHPVDMTLREKRAAFLANAGLVLPPEVL